jgi:hypothetical protein
MRSSTPLGSRLIELPVVTNGIADNTGFSKRLIEEQQMSVAFYIVLERAIPGFDQSVDGVALSRRCEALDRLAMQAGVQPLMSFFRASPEELADFVEDEGVDFDGRDIKVPPAKWFSAEEGLRTMQALLRAAEDGKVEKADQVIDELKEFSKVLETARDNGVRWHLAVDY